MSKNDFNRYAHEHARRVGRDLDITFHGFVENILASIRDTRLTFQEWRLISKEEGAHIVYYRFGYKGKTIQLNVPWLIVFTCDEKYLPIIREVIEERMKEIDDTN